MARLRRQTPKPYERSSVQWAKAEARQLFNRIVEAGRYTYSTRDDLVKLLERAELAAVRKFNSLTDPTSVKNWPEMSVEGDSERDERTSGQSEGAERERVRGILLRWIQRRKRYILDQAGRAEPTAEEAITQGGSTKHDRRLLLNRDGKLAESVTPQVAEKYLGIGERQRQMLVRSGRLDILGAGHRKRVTVSSLLTYEPGREDENPK